MRCVKASPSLLVKYSYGKGNWAETPWLAILDDRETTTTQKGTYVVFLFRSDGDGCHLKLGQGVTEIKDVFGSGSMATEELQRRADHVRAMFPGMMNTAFDDSPKQNASPRASLTKLYEASTIYSKYYNRDSLPNDQDLSDDIGVLVDCYEKYVDQGMQDTDLNDNSERKIWAISLGEGGRLWNQSFEDGIISIGWDSLGDLSNFQSQDEITEKLMGLKGGLGHTPSNDSLCCYQFVHEMKVGDLVIAKVGRKKVLGGGIVTSNYLYEPNREEHKHIREVKWLTSVKAELPGTGVATKTLTEISRYPSFKEFAETYMAEMNLNDSLTPEPYQYSDALEDLFLSEGQLKELIATAKRKKNIILQGAPGVGKTFVSRRLAYLLMGEKDSRRVEFIQFHQSYAYEDFVQGWRPNSDGGFNLRNGAFYEFCDLARGDSQRPYVFIIDEINRGNLSKIFGELLMLIEYDKRGSSNAIKLTYSESQADRFSVPENVYIIGLMNTADRSLALVDYALRRRFAFFNLSAGFQSEKFEEQIINAGGTIGLVKRIRTNLTRLNKEISEQRRDLGPGFEVGHSYFVPNGPIASEDAWYLSIIQTEIKPLIDEYWFDDPDKVDAIMSDLVN